MQNNDYKPQSNIPDLDKDLKKERETLGFIKNKQDAYEEYLLGKSSMPVIYNSKKEKKYNYLIPIVLIIAFVIMVVTFAILIYNSK